MIDDNIDIKINYENNYFLKALEAISNSKIYKAYLPELSKQHRISHIQKVLFFSQIIAQNENLKEKQIKILLASAAFHDCGRTKDRDNGEHGTTSAKIAGEYFRRNVYNYYGIEKDEVGLIQVAIEYHVIEECIIGKIDEIKLKELCKKYSVNDSVNDEEYENVKIISAILKDADALDRTRFVSGNNLDPVFLRTKTAKNRLMIETAKKVNERYAYQIINLNYPSIQNVSDDKIKLLHDIRRKYKAQNMVNQINEIDIPLNIVLTIFKDGLTEEKYSYKNMNYIKHEEDVER